MNFKGLSFLFIFIIIHYIVYVYFQNKYSSRNKDLIEVKYIVPPVTYEDYFKFKDLNKFYSNIFGRKEKNLDLIKSEY